MNKPILHPKSVEITRGTLPGSRKVYAGGVPFREVALSGKLGLCQPRHGRP